MKKIITLIFGISIMLLFGFQKPAENIDIEKKLGYNLPEIKNIDNQSYHSNKDGLLDFDEWSD